MTSPCHGCPSRTQHDGKSTAKVRRKARFLVVGANPTRRMIDEKRFMSTPGFALFGEHMAAAGFYDEDFSYCNSIRCAYDPDLYDTQDNKAIKSNCRQHLLRVIEHVDPEVIIPLGADAASMVMGRAVKITKARGVPVYHDALGCWVMPTANPHQVHTNPQDIPLFKSDAQTLRRLVDFDYDVEAAGKSRLGEYEIVHDLQFLIDESPTELCVDVETLGLHWFKQGNDLMTIQLCPEPGRGYLIPWNHPESTISCRSKNRIRKQLRTLLTKPKSECEYYGQNLKFDVLWLWHIFGFRMRIDHDSEMLAALVDENLQSKGLDTLTKLYVPSLAGYADSFNAKHDKSRMDLVPMADILDYGCADTDASLQVAKALLQLLQKDKALLNHYNRVSIPGINAFVPIERRGQYINECALDNLEQVFAKQVEEQKEALIAQVPPAILRDHMEKGISFTRAEFIRDILFTHPDGFRLTPQVFTSTTQRLSPSKRVPSVSSKDHLPFFFDDCPFTVDLAEHVKSLRLLGTSIRKFRQNYVYEGKVHPTYSLARTVTGRTASRDPNSQNYIQHGPAAKAYQAIFVPPAGKIKIGADYSQAELRIAADMANERTMLGIYREGGDIHVSTAAVVKSMAIEDFLALAETEVSEARRGAKAVNFGYLYGMWWKSFVGYAKTRYGVDFTDQEAERVRNDFFGLYPGLDRWHEDMKAFAMQNGYVRSYSGRVRHLPMVYSDDEGIHKEALRQAINSPVQEFASSLGVITLARLKQEIDPQYLTPSGFIHDALYAYVDPEHLVWGAKTLKRYMESAPIERWFGVKMRVKMAADVGFGYDGGNTYEMKGLELDKPFDLAAMDLPFDMPEQTVPPADGRYLPQQHLRLPSVTSK